MAAPRGAVQAVPAQAQIGDQTGPKYKDVRPVAGPSARQHALAQRPALTVRWNRLGAPAAVSSAQPLATGLPADPEQAARAYLKANQELYGLSDQGLGALEKVSVTPVGKGAIVILRQRFGTLPSGYDGLVSIAALNGSVIYVSSSLARDSAAPAPATLSQSAAESAAAKDAGLDPAKASPQRIRLVAVPTGDGARSAYQVVLYGGTAADPVAVNSYVDARTGTVLVRQDLIDDDTDNPRWKAFPVSPPGDYSSTDTRRIWCGTAGPGCDEVHNDPATGLPWDVDHATGRPTYTSLGNAARTYENRASGDPRTVGTRTSATRPDRDYTYPWTNQWTTSKCDPASLDSAQEADVDAAIANLNAMHNRMHDWSYLLGFTEQNWNMEVDNGGRGGLGNDPEQGNAQAGARIATVRDNANQITPPDGVAPISNMYLWQPIAGSFYAPCVDGDFDMTVVGHENSHAISGRLIGGPDAGWTGFQAGAMNESTSDLFAMEYLYEFGYRPVGNTPYVTGGYVTSDHVTGIRNYDMSNSPLNYSDIGYDLVGPEVHSDGDIWSPIQFDVRRAFVQRYGNGTPAIQRACAEGRVALDHCPGNRRWIQLSFDALLLMANPAVSFVDHRDALLAADRLRFGGADQAMMWDAFARRGLGSAAASNGPSDLDPVASFASPYARNATVRIKPAGQAAGASVRLYVGDYEARAVPIADTDPATSTGDSFTIAPGTYDFLAVGNGFGFKRFRLTVHAGTHPTLPLVMSRNLAAAANGAAATGDGTDQGKLIDETETTNWSSLTAPVAGRQVTVQLAGGHAAPIGRVQVSAMLRPVQAGDPETPSGAAGQNRFTALRSFQVLACNADRGQDCTQDSAYHVIYTSPKDAFPSRVPRPRVPDLDLRSFRLPTTLATHLRLRVLTSQCTGNPAFNGEQDNDPRSTTDCRAGSPFAGLVRVAEFQAFTG